MNRHLVRFDSDIVNCRVTSSADPTVQDRYILYCFLEVLYFGFC